MYPSSLSRRAISTFTPDAGMAAVSCSALLALRMRASMSAIGSVSIALPGALRHARDDARVRQLAQADPAQPELPVHGARPSAAIAAPIAAALEPLRPGGLGDQGFLCHSWSPSVWIIFASCETRASRGRRERS